MSKLSLSNVVANEEAGMLALSAAPLDVPACVIDAVHKDQAKSQAQSTDAVDKLNLEALTGMKIVQPMRIHRYRRG